MEPAGRRGITNRDADTVHAEITKTQDSGTVRDDADLGVGIRPVLEHCADGLALLDADVQGFGAGVEGGVLEADIANGGWSLCKSDMWNGLDGVVGIGGRGLTGVDEGHELADVVDEEAVEQVDVLVLEGGEVEVLVDIGLAGVDHLHRPLALHLQALHSVRDEASEVPVDAVLGGEGEACDVHVLVGDGEVGDGGKQGTEWEWWRRGGLTLIPEGLAQDLVATGSGLGDIADLLGLLDLAEGGGGIAPVLVERGGLHLVFDGRDVD